MSSLRHLREIAAACLANKDRPLAIELRRVGGDADSGVVMIGTPRPPLEVSSIKVTPAPQRLAQTGLLAWVSCTVDGQFRFDGLTVRRTRDGRVIVSFPSRRDSDGRERAYVAPLREDVRRSIEEQILHALDFEGEVAS